MPTVKMDTVETIEAEDQYGNVMKLVRKAYVLGLTGVDYTDLFSALAAAGIPAAGTVIAQAPNCVLTRRSARMIDGDKAEVLLTYEYALNEGYNMSSPPFGVVFGEGSSSLNQKDTNLDKDDNVVFTSYAYPSTDIDYPSKTLDQGGKFDFLQPQHTLKFKGLKFDNTPGATARSMEGNTNNGDWNGGVAGTWICTAVNYRLFDQASSPARYFFDLEFQYNPDGWDPTIIYIDDRTAKPPKDLVPGTGYKVVPRYDRINFDSTFGVTLVGE